MSIFKTTFRGGPSRPTNLESYLYEVQRRAFGAIGEPPPAATNTTAASVLARNAGRLSAEDYQRWKAEFELESEDGRGIEPLTPYESAGQTALYAGLQAAILRSLKERRLAIPTMPVIASLPTHSLDPLIVIAPDDERPIIAVDPQMPTFVNLLGKATAQFFLSQEDTGEQRLDFSARDWPAVLDWDHPAIGCYVDMVLAAVAGRPAWARPYLPPSLYEWLSSDIRDIAEQFLLARCFVHLAAGHVQDGSETSYVLPGLEVNTRTFSVEQEAEADAVALGLVVAHQRHAGRPMASVALSVESLLATLSILESTRALLRGEPEASPSGGRHALRGHCLRHLIGVHDGHDGQAAAFAAMVNPAFAVLWDRLQAALTDPEARSKVTGPGLCQLTWSLVSNECSESIELSSALATFREGAFIAPGNACAWQRLAGSLEASGDRDGAISALQRALELKPDDARQWSALAAIASRLGRSEEAILAGRKAVSGNPEDNDAWRALGMALCSTGRTDCLQEAAACLGRLVEHGVGDANDLSLLAGVSIELGDSAMVEQAVHRLVQLSGEPEAWWSIGMSCLTRGRDALAIEAFERSTAVAAKPEVLCTLAVLYSRNGQPSKGEAAARLAADIDPGYPLAWANLSDACGKQDRWDEAVAFARRAVDVDRACAGGWANLGEALEHLGDLRGAAEACDEAVRLEPDEADFCAIAARVYERCGRRADAHRVLERMRG